MSAICSVITQWSESRRTRKHTLLSHLDPPNPEGLVPVFISPRNRVAQLYPRALGSLYVVSYDLLITTRWATLEVFKPSPNLEGQVPVHISFRNRLVQS
jgi:hypothetical protein